MTYWRWPARASSLGEICSTSSSQSWAGASTRIRDASARCGPRCKTSATIYSRSPACFGFGEQWNNYGNLPITVPLLPEPVLDDKLIGIAQAHGLPEHLVRAACMLHRKPSISPAYWHGWIRLRARMRGQFHAVFDAVAQAMAQTPRSSALVENLNSRLRNYFTLRRQMAGSYLSLLQFFLNHRCFLRSRRPERVGKSPSQLMTGQNHPHWLTLLGFGPLQPQRA